MTQIRSSQVLLPEGRLVPARITFEDEYIVDVQEDHRNSANEAGALHIDGIIAPGYIDLHTHGYGGCDFGTATVDEILETAGSLPATGVTAFLPTIASAPARETIIQVERLAHAAQIQTAGTVIAGIRLEGPYLSLGKRGAQPRNALRLPSLHEFDELIDLSHGLIKMIDVAPELPGALELMAYAERHNVIACTGHTEASTEATLHAIKAGARHCTHLFNGMPALHHREPGPAGVYLAEDETTVEIIADGIHLHPETLKLVAKVKGPDHCILITDAILAAGLADGEYEFLGRHVTVNNGAVRLPDGTLAGSTLSLDRAVANMNHLAHVSLPVSLQMASASPAKILGDNHRGNIAPGNRADFAILDPELHVTETWIGGAIVRGRVTAHARN